MFAENSEEQFDNYKIYLPLPQSPAVAPIANIIFLEGHTDIILA
jgi:hypothetical protein